MANHEVAIVGGGMVGAALALDLGKRGIAVRVIEANPPPVPTANAPRLRVCALNQRSVDYLHSLGAWAALDQTRLADFDEVMVWDIAANPRLVFNAAELGLERLGVFLENDHLQATLLASASEQASVSVTAPAPELSVSPGEAGVSLSLAGEGELSPALIVAADGARSNVRDAAGIDVWQSDYGQFAVVASVHTQPAAAHQTWQRFTPEGPQALLPLANGDASLVWYVSPSRAQALLDLPEAAFIQALEEAFPADLGRIETLYERGGFPIKRLHAQRYWADNAVLVGDSAHVIHPLAGQGVNIGLRDARVLAERIADAHAKGLPLAHPAGLAAYERARRPDNQLMQSTMTGLHWAFTAPLGPIAPIRGFALGLAHHGGGLKKRVLRYALTGSTRH